MNNVGNWISIGLKALPLITAAMASIERFFKGTGVDKENAAYLMFADLLELTEGVTGKDLADDAKIEDATRNVFKAVVAFQNLVRDVKLKQASGASS